MFQQITCDCIRVLDAGVHSKTFIGMPTFSTTSRCASVTHDMLRVPKRYMARNLGLEFRIGSRRIGFRRGDNARSSQLHCARDAAKGWMGLDGVRVEGGKSITNFCYDGCIAQETPTLDWLDASSRQCCLTTWLHKAQRRAWKNAPVLSRMMQPKPIPTPTKNHHDMAMWKLDHRHLGDSRFWPERRLIVPSTAHHHRQRRSDYRHAVLEQWSTHGRRIWTS